MVFQKSPDVRNTDQFSLGSTTLEHTTQYTYLGLTITASGSYSMAVNALKVKAQRALHAIKETILIFEKYWFLFGVNILTV